MRTFFNNILTFIGSTSLTDGEFLTMLSQDPTLNQSTYDDLARVLSSREAISTMQTRLLSFYQAKGVELTQFKTAKTNIFIGAVLD